MSVLMMMGSLFLHSLVYPPPCRDQLSSIGSPTTHMLCVCVRAAIALVSLWPPPCIVVISSSILYTTHMLVCVASTSSTTTYSTTALYSGKAQGVMGLFIIPPPPLFLPDGGGGERERERERMEIGSYRSCQAGEREREVEKEEFLSSLCRGKHFSTHGHDAVTSFANVERGTL